MSSISARNGLSGMLDFGIGCCGLIGSIGGGLIGSIGGGLVGSIGGGLIGSIGGGLIGSIGGGLIGSIGGGLIGSIGGGLVGSIGGGLVGSIGAVEVGPSLSGFGRGAVLWHFLGIITVGVQEKGGSKPINGGGSLFDRTGNLGPVGAGGSRGLGIISGFSE